MRILFRANATASIPDLTCDVHDVFKGTDFDTLRYAAEKLCRSFGLRICDVKEIESPVNQAVIEFRTGTDERWTAYQLFD